MEEKKNYNRIGMEEEVLFANAPRHLIEMRDPKVFGRNVRAFRALRGWGIRELSSRAGVSVKTIVKIERGEGCTSRTEQKIALGFGAYVGRLWDASLLSDEKQRLISKEGGRWFFIATEDADRFHHRLIRTQLRSPEDRLRSDPDEIQDETERHRLGHGGLACGFAKTMGGGLAGGYYQFNRCEIFGRDYTPGDGLGYHYLCICMQGGVRMGIRDQVLEAEEGDSIVYDGSDALWAEPLHPIQPDGGPTLIHLVCLGMLALPKR